MKRVVAVIAQHTNNNRWGHVETWSTNRYGEYGDREEGMHALALLGTAHHWLATAAMTAYDHGFVTLFNSRTRMDEFIEELNKRCPIEEVSDAEKVQLVRRWISQQKVHIRMSGELHSAEHGVVVMA